MKTDKYDVIIVGAGPAGSSCALKLATSGLRVALIDKAKFPRDKVCGDALSVDVINQLSTISETLFQSFLTHPGALPSYGVRIFSPDLNSIAIPFIHKGKPENGYIFPRIEFDNVLLECAKNTASVDVMEDCLVQNVLVNQEGVELTTTNGILYGKFLIGADGAHSVVRKLLHRNMINRKHCSAGLRTYYQGVTSFHSDNYIDLYFFKTILPGYLWIFPLTEGRANVGIGVLSSKVASKKIDLKKILHELITTHPNLKGRFEKATPLETPKGFGLPLGSDTRKLSGERFLLVGDAAGLIDPFSGEGVANAMRSGRIAAQHIQKCFQHQNFSDTFNKAYDRDIYAKMGNEFRISRTLQRLCQYPLLFNYILNKANRDRAWHQFLIDALADVDQKDAFTKVKFYYKLFFR